MFGSIAGKVVKKISGNTVRKIKGNIAGKMGKYGGENGQIWWGKWRESGKKI